ncbi:hypothetical protein GJAV_G00036300 [Gymnothorax javanicus]|nr:hypothetical protein GJAV_G00036300 [Gymnothorax javanicus]
MGKGKNKVLAAANVQHEEVSDLRDKETKENHQKTNGEKLTCGQTTICSFLSPDKPRPLPQDNPLEILPGAKFPSSRTAQTRIERKGGANYTVQGGTDRKGGGRLEVISEGGDVALPEAGVTLCPPAGTQEVPEVSGQCRSSAERVGSTPEKGPRQRTKKKPARKTQDNNSQNRKVTDYYPIRRSSRKSGADLKSEELRQMEELVLQGVEEGLQVRHIEGKGRGVFAGRSFRKGQFVVEYQGDLLEMKDAKRREEQYCRDPAAGCYMYYFQYLSKAYCVDATKETGRLGRLINHSKSGNCQTKLHGINGKPHLILVASRDIQAGEELLYDYGDRSKDSIAAHPWLKY